MIATATSGFLLLLGLVVAIGAQNAFVLRQGLRREHVGVVVAICALSDAVLIAVGTAGVGRFIASQQGLLTAVTLAGVAILLWYAWAAAKRVIHPESLAVDDGASPSGSPLTDTHHEVGGAAPGGASSDTTSPLATATRTRPTKASSAVVPASLGSVVLTALALTWLNPHVYLDTVVLLGSVSATYAQPWVFALGAAIGSILWFTALGFGARLLAPLFARPIAWRVFDGTIAVVMVAIAIKLLLGVL